jgi:hypothetical protein
VTGIVKPDVVAPGQLIVSARSIPSGAPRGEEDRLDYLAVAEGTSMATGNVAGSVAIIEQYLARVYQRRLSSPSASLLRAILINSADQVPAVSASYTPNNDVGFGQVNLGRYIPKNGDSFALILNDTVWIRRGEHLVTKISVTNSSSPLRVTVAYVDPPASSDSLFPIVADLDVVVVSPSRRVFRGNNHPQASEEHFSTTERVVIDDPEIGDYIIHVLLTATQLVTGVDFSIVVTGPLDPSDYSLPFTATKTCLPCGRGTCGADGQCVCGDGGTGLSCQIMVRVMAPVNEMKTDVIIQPLEVAYILIKRATPTVLRWQVSTISSFPIRAYVVEAERAPTSPVDYAEAFWNRTSVSGMIEGEMAGALLIRNDFTISARYSVVVSMGPGATPIPTGEPITEAPASAHGTKVAIIVGGVVGGVVAVALLAGVVYYCLRQRGSGASSSQSSRLLES